MDNDKITKKISIDKPTTFLNPVPVVMVSCKGVSDEIDKDNIITIAWAGTVNSEPPMVSISVRKSRFSHKQIVESKEFAVNLVSENILDKCDYCGVKSGKDVDKFEDCNFEKEYSSKMKFACGIKNSPVTLYCKVKQIIELGSHDLFIGEIVDITVDKNLYESSGKIDLNKGNLVVFSHGEYMGIKEAQGFFGYSVANDKALKRRLPKIYKKIINNKKNKADK